MNLDASAVETAQSIFSRHHKVCLACKQCPLDGKGEPAASSLPTLCFTGTGLFKKLLRARTEMERRKVAQAQAKAVRTKK